MKVKQVDLETRGLTLDAGTTKNDDEDRVIKMTEEVCELVRICVTGKSPDDHVFTRPNGQPVRDFRGAWWALLPEGWAGDIR